MTLPRGICARSRKATKWVESVLLHHGTEVCAKGRELVSRRRGKVVDTGVKVAVNGCWDTVARDMLC